MRPDQHRKKDLEWAGATIANPNEPDTRRQLARGVIIATLTEMTGISLVERAHMAMEQDDRLACIEILSKTPIDDARPGTSSL